MGGGPSSNNNTSTSSTLPAPLHPSAPPSIEVTAPTPTEKRQAKALYDYDAADSTELSLLADEVMGLVSFLPTYPAFIYIYIFFFRFFLSEFFF